MRLNRGAARRGVAAVEFAVVFPFVLGLLLGIWEVGRLVEVQQVMSNAAREGGRQAASGQKTKSEVESLVTTYLQLANLPTGNANVVCTNVTSGKDPTAADYLDKLEVTITLPFADVRWSMISWFVPAGFQLSTKATWVSMRDKPFPAFPVPPIG